MSPDEWEDLSWDMKRAYLDGMRAEGIIRDGSASIPSSHSPVQPPLRRQNGRQMGTVAQMNHRTVTAKVRFPDDL